MLASVASAVPFNLGQLEAHDDATARDQDRQSRREQSSFETFGVGGIDHPLSACAEFSLEDAAMSFVQSKLNVASSGAVYRTGYSNDVVQHAYIHQQINGIPVTNAVANVAFNRDNKVVSFGSSFINVPSNVPSATPSISAKDAITKAENALGGTYNQHPTKLEYVAKQDGSVDLAHVVQVRNDSKAMWYEAFVDAHTGEIVQLTDFVSHASYRVLPITKQNILQGFETLTDPQNLASSPYGWHSEDGTTSTNDTSSGNNVIAFVAGDDNFWYTTGPSSPPLNFVYYQDATQAPDALQANIDAARVNTFYVANAMHDIAYQYGFTETAYNFQDYNFGRGGAENDRVELSVQDANSTDNSYFYTPPDGQPGYMQMGIWYYATPARDSSLANDLIVHEYTHGITNRMTGGGTGRHVSRSIRGRLQVVLEADGLGEGWSDAFAEWTHWQSPANTFTDWIMAAYVYNNPAGIRRYPYSTNTTTNPLRYSNLQTLTEPHDIGEVWANMLHNVYAQLVAAHGYSDTAMTDPSTTGGNTVYLHLFLDALPLQPCNPTFPQARDAWIQADANRYGGANYCTLWGVFASRGLGVNADDHVDDMTVPPGC
uniref:Extracellular metalloproteinase n=1 Tax=Ganoderma boninense TaxID=34458 RepID=A0A5K1JR82_9APHY|nr:Extracellular metalloproteinase 5 (EC (Fungalysin MEP5) [Ganoderma boninense]